MLIPTHSDTICALATPPGQGALAVIRVSGPESMTVLSELFLPVNGHKKDFSSVRPNTIHFGRLIESDQVIDEVLVSIFRSPRSYTGEDVAEISIHGSVYIQQLVLQLLQRHGCRLAQPGEFTLRAFINGKIDLSQAEAVADLIAAQHAGAHQAALQQLRGGYSNIIRDLRRRLIDFASLIELELDFSEEDVEFADRTQMLELVMVLNKEVRQLNESFSSGNVLKHGVPVLIAGKPNVGKSTLLNALLNEERAIVSDIAGTTRDVVEDHLVINNVRFRFMDTAGIRDTDDTIEKMGVERTFANAAKSSIVLYLCDPGQSPEVELMKELEVFCKKSGTPHSSIITLINKCDRFGDSEIKSMYSAFPEALSISAKEQINIEKLKNNLSLMAAGMGVQSDQNLVTNARHAEALQAASIALQRVIDGIKNKLMTDLLALELKTAIHHLGNITGEVHTDDLLANIFSKFCIGK
jgi:tRNA modification GTPase